MTDSRKLPPERVVIDDFLPNASEIRLQALAAPFRDIAAPDGETYKRVCPTVIPGLAERLAEVCGPVEMLLTAYRLNYAGEMPNAAVHSDIGWGTHALVLYLCDGEGGTGFWRHKATGADRLGIGDVSLFERVRGDWNNADAWELQHLAPLKFNRTAIYDSTLFHSRYPFAAFGDCPENGRLIAVSFFNAYGVPSR